MGTRRITIMFTALLVVCMSASALVVRRVDQLRAGATLEEVGYVPSSKLLQRLSLGYDSLLADVYWTRAVQYFGSQHHAKATHYDLLAPLLDLTTDLDPHLIVAYQFGSIFLSQQPPEGAGQPRKAVELVEKGIRENPEYWKLYFNLGWIQYSELKDYQAASQTFERGAQVPKSSPSLRVLAAAMAQHGGDFATARFMWTQIYQTTEDKTIRANAVKRLEALTVDEDITKLEQVLAAYRQASGHFPTKWGELLATGWRGSITDPEGNPYRLMPDGRVEVQDPDQLPFITKGLPLGQAPSLFANSREKMKAVKSASAAADNPSKPATPESKH